MHLQLLGSITSPVGLQKLPIKENLMAAYFFIRITATTVGAPATTEDDFGTFKLSNKDGDFVNCTGTMLRHLANIFHGNPIYTPGGGVGAAVEYYIPIPCRMPGEANVFYSSENDGFQFSWEPGPNLNGRLTANSMLLTLNYIPGFGQHLYDLRVIRRVKPLPVAARDTILIDEENIAAMFLTDAQTLPETLASGGLQGGNVGINFGPYKSYSAVQECISATQSLLRVEGAADFANMACIFDAAIVGEGYAGDLFDKPSIEVNTTAASTPTVLSLSKRFRRNKKATTRNIVNAQLDAVYQAAGRNGWASKQAIMEEARLV